MLRQFGIILNFQIFDLPHGQDSFEVGLLSFPHFLVVSAWLKQIGWEGIGRKLW